MKNIYSIVNALAFVPQLNIKPFISATKKKRFFVNKKGIVFCKIDDDCEINQYCDDRILYKICRDKPLKLTPIPVYVEDLFT